MNMDSKLPSGRYFKLMENESTICLYGTDGDYFLCAISVEDLNSLYSQIKYIDHVRQRNRDNNKTPEAEIG